MRTKITSNIVICALFGALPFTSLAPAQVLTSESFVISSGAGGSGAAQASCMIMSDGTSWSGGAVGVQGATSTKMGGGSPLAANVTFKYNVGNTVDSLNSTFGAGNWTIANPALTFQYTLYANNTRFGGGAGTFDIYWMGNDDWVQGTANSIYATSESALRGWAGTDALLGSESYNWSTPDYTGTTADLGTSVWTIDKSGIRQSTVSYSLGLNSGLVGDITSSTAGANPNLSLYLMGTSETLGLTIFTGGGNSLPTLSFDVVPVPEPSVLALVGLGLSAWLVLRRRK